MTIAESLLQELDQESQATRRALERVPDAHLSWKPHVKSMSLGQLSLHIATLPIGVAMLASQDDVQVPQFPQPSPATSSELVPALEDTIARVRSLLNDKDDAWMTATWRLLAGDQVLIAMPRVAFLRAIMLNHWYHHRGQLCVYLRQLDVPVPAIYGPSADENPFVTLVTQ